MKYDLRPALRDDIESGSIWLGSPSFTPRTIVKVRSTETGRAVFCEVKIIDDFFLENYRKAIGISLAEPSKAVFVNAWYRKHLAIALTDEEVSLDVTAADTFPGKVRACLHHPQVVVRLATILGLWSLALSVIGVALAVVSFLPKRANQQAPTPTTVTPPTRQP